MARAKIGEHYGDQVDALLEEGEALAGFSVASEQQSVFKGRAVLLVVTDRRLLVQGLDRRGNPSGEPISMPPAEIESAKADGAGGGWPELTAALMDGSAIKLKIRLRSGAKHQFMLMRGTGPLGGLGGGETQRQGVEALASFFERAAA